MRTPSRQLSRALGRPCHWIGGGVDTLRFSPYPTPAARVIDVYQIGRTTPGLHKALRQAAAAQGLFFLYDTFQGSDMEPFDHREHRERA